MRRIPRAGSRNLPRGPTHGTLSNVARSAAIPAPRPNLSFDDPRPINDLPIVQNIASNGVSGSGRGNCAPATGPTFKFELASPEEFLAKNWATSSDRGRATGANVTRVSESMPHTAVEPQSANPIKLNTQPAQVKSLLAPALPAAQQTSSEQSIERASQMHYEDLFRETVKIEKEMPHSIVQLGCGRIRFVKAVDGQETSVFVKVETQDDEPVLSLQLTESLQYQFGSSQVSFYSEIKGKDGKWNLKFALPWKAENLKKHLEQQLQSIAKMRSSIAASTPASLSGSTQNDLSSLGAVEDVELLISFDEEDPAPQPLSSWSEELRSLMDDQAIDQALEIINSDPAGTLLEQISAEIAKSETLKEKEENGSSLAESDDVEAPRPPFRGLATSIYADANVAAASVVGKWMERTSRVFSALPEEATAALVDTMGKRALEMVHKPESEHGAIQQSRLTYGIDELIKYRNQASRLIGSFLEYPWLPRQTSSEPRVGNVVQKTRFGVNIVEGVERPARSETSSGWGSGSARSEPTGPEPSKSWVPKPLGLATSKYAAPPISELGSLPSKPKAQNSASKSPNFYSSSGSADNPALYAARIAPPSVESPPMTISSAAMVEVNVSASADTPETMMKKFGGLSTSKYAARPKFIKGNNVATSSFARDNGPQAPSAPQFRIDSHGKVIHESGELVHDLGSGPQHKAILEDVASSVTSLGNLIGNRPTPSSSGAAERVERAPLVPISLDKSKFRSDRFNAVSSPAVVESSTFNSPVTASWNGLRRESFNSHNSKDSVETIKPAPADAVGPSVHNDDPAQSTPKTFRHNSMLSTDSSASSASFATATEGGSPPGGELNSVQNGKDLVDGLQNVIQTLSQQETGSAPMAPKLENKQIEVTIGYSKDMSELMDLSVNKVQIDTPITVERPFLNPSKLYGGPKRAPAVAPGKGLLSSRFAADLPGYDGPMKPASVQSLAVNLRQSVSNTGSFKTELSPHANNNEGIRRSTSNPVTLRPAAAQFTPCIRNSFISPASHAAPTSAINFQRFEPVVATILVPDLGMPGIFREVSGLLKGTNFQAMAQHNLQNSASVKRVDENLAPRPTFTIKSPPAVIEASVRAPSTPGFQQTGNQESKDLREEVQQRLQKSMEKPRLSF